VSDVETRDDFVRWATALESTEAKTARGFPEMPAGKRFAWWVSPDWRILRDGEADGSRCRRPKCHRPPVAVLMRPRKQGAVSIRVPYLYCDEHLYGNRIEDGRVIHLRVREAS
jgi:hypothetical protein